MGATTYHSFSPHHKTIGKSELQFTKYPVEIFYSQGGDTGSEVKLSTRIFAATGVMVQVSDSTFSGTNKEFFATLGFTPFRFHAFIGKTDEGVLYSSSLMVVHPDGGSIQLDDGNITNIIGPKPVQEELEKIAKLILSNL